MKRFIMAGLVIFFSSSILFAHPPKDILISAENEKIVITAIHDVKDPVKHFIIKIIVSVNDQKVIEQAFIKQADNEKQVAQYLFPGLKAGDKIKAEAQCNIFGKLAKEAVVNTDTQNQGQVIPKK
jgi:hypothetical protein